MSLTTPDKIRNLQRKLYCKAKAEPIFRFYLLYDKICREDILVHAYRLARLNAGAPGVDGMTFARIEGQGLEAWLAGLRAELVSKTYRPDPVRRVMIPKANGGERPLGIPTIRDRVIQTAAKIVIEPIFEADFEDNAYGYRPARGAVDAVKEVHRLICRGYTDVVDADLSRYFDSIPHNELLKSVARRVADGSVLRLVKLWLKVPQGSADPAITPSVEGWLVPLELRVLAQVTPDNAPFVVASVGGLPEIENNIVVPTIRSIVRNVVGAQGRQVLDLADNRAALEHAVEDAIRPEGLRAGIVVKEVKFGDPALPPELLVSRLRQQVADQLQVTYQQEQKAQTQRIETEKARATAEQQHQLVEAVIGVQVSEQNKNAAKLRGEGQKLELEEIAQGQRAQADVLGQDRVLTITLVQQLLKTIQEKPEVVSLIGRLVPQTVVSTGGQGAGLDSAAAVLGALINNGGGATPALTGPSSKK